MQGHRLLPGRAGGGDARLGYVGADGQHGAGRSPDHWFRRRAKEQPVNGMFPVDAEDDEIGLLFGRDAENLVMRTARQDQLLDLQP